MSKGNKVISSKKGMVTSISLYIQLSTFIIPVISLFVFGFGLQTLLLSVLTFAIRSVSSVLMSVLLLKQKDCLA